MMYQCANLFGKGTAKCFCVCYPCFHQLIEWVLPGVSSCYNSEGAIKDFQKIKDKLLSELVRGGMTPLLPKIEHAGPPEILHVHLDGCIVGSIASAKIDEIVNYLRRLKLLSHPAVCSLAVFVVSYFSCALHILLLTHRAMLKFCIRLRKI
jgi:hypothetical protein